METKEEEGRGQINSEIVTTEIKWDERKNKNSCLPSEYDEQKTSYRILQN